MKNIKLANVDGIAKKVRQQIKKMGQQNTMMGAGACVGSDSQPRMNIDHLRR